MAKNEPLPCPFCGHLPEIVRVSDYVCCRTVDCPVGMWVPLDRWNKRVQPVDVETLSRQFADSLKAQQAACQKREQKLVSAAMALLNALLAHSGKDGWADLVTDIAIPGKKLEELLQEMEQGE